MLFFLSRLADHCSRPLKLILVLFMAMSFVSILLICYCLIGVIAFNKAIVYILFGLIGFFLNGTIPFFYELGVEITYPVAEGITTGFMTFLNAFLLSVFLVVPLGNLGTKWMLWTTVCTCAVSTIFLIFVKENYNRSNVDQKAIDRTQRSNNI